MMLRGLIPVYRARWSASSSLSPVLRRRSSSLRIPVTDLSENQSLSLTAAMSNSREPAKTDEQTEEFVYSVWAFPPEGVRDRLKDIMSALRSEFGGPEFEPHITVVGAIRLTPAEALRRFRSATTALSSYSARVNAPSRGTFFYQCVYLLIDPTTEVVEASANCCDHFGYNNSTPYMPHLSLLYGDLTDEEKEKARRRVEELDEDIRGLSFEVSAIALYRTDTEDKSLKSWENIEVINLGIPNIAPKKGE